MILTLIESQGDTVSELTLEALTLARKVASESNSPMEAVSFATDATQYLNQLAGYGVTRVHHVQHERLTSYAPDAWAGSLEHLIEFLAPLAIVAAGSDHGTEVMARLAARTNLSLAANCVEVNPGEPFHLTRIRWGGTLLEDATLGGNPKLLTVAPHTISPQEAPEKTDPEVAAVTPPLEDIDFRVQVKERTKAEEGLSLATAPVVIGGGRGVGSAEAFGILEGLAQALGGAVGASRVATNEGWRPHSDQIGQTGTRIAPDIYIACGISGATQHMVGCSGAKNILVINLDGEAPILSKADYAVIGDLHEVVPALTKAVKEATG